MVKKESTKRGYMTPGEVRAHIRGIPTTGAKIHYLQETLFEQRQRLAPKTRESIKEQLVDLHARKGSVEEAWNYADDLHDDAYSRAVKKVAEGYEHRGDLRFKNKLANLTPNDEHDILKDYCEAYNKLRYISGENNEGEKEGQQRLLGKIKPLANKFHLNINDLVEIDRPKSGWFTAILGLAGSIFFLSANITGNALGDITNPTSNLIGLGLFLVGLVSALVYFRKK